MNDQDSSAQGAELTPLEVVAQDMGDPGLFPVEVHRLYKAGKVRKARKHLLKHARTERSAERAVKQREAADDLRLWLSPAKDGPGMFSINGIGTRLVGRQQERDDGSYVGTLWFTIVFLPVWAISSYLVLPADKGWHFLARTPIPTVHGRSRWLSGAVLGGLAVLGGSWVLDARTHTDLFVYNGFDRPLFAYVNGVEKNVPSRGHALFEDLPLESASLEARWERDAEPIENLDVDLAGQGRATIVYNVASRGLVAISYVRYGEGIPQDDRWLDPGPVLAIDERLDYRFVEPPDSLTVRASSDGIEKSVLHAFDDGGQPAGIVSALIADGRPEQALAMARAELEIAPENATLAAVTAQGVFADDRNAQLELLRWCLERAPEAVDLHRAYQELWPNEDRDALRAEYEALRRSHESSAMYHYLSARIQETGSDAELRQYRTALSLDPEYGPVFRGLGFRALTAGNWSEALMHYERFASLGASQALETLDTRLRVGRRVGRSAEQGKRIVEEMLENHPEALGLPILVAHYAVTVAPLAVDAAVQGFLDAVTNVITPADSEMLLNGVGADLAVTAGDLEAARTRLAASDLSGRNADAGLRLALSTGATEADRRLLFDIPDWFDRLTPLLQPIALELVDFETATAMVASASKRLQNVAILLEDEGRLLDRTALEAIVGTDLEWLAAVSWAAARRLDGVEGAAAARARREYSRTAARFALPGELPYADR